MHVIPLGTASAIPTRTRHLSGMALVVEGRVLLFDCGEGTQMQLIQAGVKHMRIEAIFISHFHGDHFYGLFGLLATLALLQRPQPITIVGPHGIGDVVTNVPGLDPTFLPFSLEFVEMPLTMQRERVYATSTFTVDAAPVEHREFTAGFRFEERPKPGKLDVERAVELGVTDPTQYRLLKQGRSVRAGGREVRSADVVGPPQPGRSFAYVSDTRPCANSVSLAHRVDLLYHEATFGAELADRAVATGHSTATEAAEVARAARASRLLIGHFSARYAEPQPLVDEARTVFAATEAAEELKSYSVG